LWYISPLIRVLKPGRIILKGLFDPSGKRLEGEITIMDVKVCPGCGAEYFAHITDCADCKVPLKSPEEMNRHETATGGDFLPVREGGVPWLKELREELKKNGLVSHIDLKPDCSPASCNVSGVLLVCENDIERAKELLEEYFLQSHPEMANHLDVDHESQCPACGHHAGPDDRECADCGLALVF